MSNISAQDWKYMEQNPYGDPDFSEEHNKRVIAEVNAENDEMDKQRDRDHSNSVRERSEAVASYLNNITQGKGVTDIEKYFGKRHLAYLRGQKIEFKWNKIYIDKN